MFAAATIDEMDMAYDNNIVVLGYIDTMPGGMLL